MELSQETEQLLDSIEKEGAKESPRTHLPRHGKLLTAWLPPTHLPQKDQSRAQFSLNVSFLLAEAKKAAEAAEAEAKTGSSVIVP